MEITTLVCMGIPCVISHLDILYAQSRIVSVATLVSLSSLAIVAVLVFVVILVTLAGLVSLVFLAILGRLSIVVSRSRLFVLTAP